MNRRWGFLVLLLGAVVINLPVAHSAYYGWRLDAEGVRTTAEVLEARELPPEDDPTFGVQFRFDADIDPEQREWLATVDRETFEDAEDSGVIDVRVLADHPSTYEAEGQQRSRMGLVLTLFGDLMLLAFAVALWKAPPRLTEVHLLAAGDVEIGRRKPGMQRIHGEVYEVYGEVAEIDDDTVVLDIGGRQTVHVRLNGHRNRVGYQQAARVVGTPVDTGPGVTGPDRLGG